MRHALGIASICSWVAVVRLNCAHSELSARMQANKASANQHDALSSDREKEAVTAKTHTRRRSPSDHSRCLSNHCPHAQATPETRRCFPVKGARSSHAGRTDDLDNISLTVHITIEPAGHSSAGGHFLVSCVSPTTKTTRTRHEKVLHSQVSIALRMSSAHGEPDTFGRNSSGPPYPKFSLWLPERKAVPPVRTGFSSNTTRVRPA